VPARVLYQISLRARAAHARVDRAPQRRAVQPAFRNEDPGATQPQKSQTRDVEYLRATRSVSVSHPTLGGLTERVERVVDTLDSMLKAGPRHLDTRQSQAAQIFRSAYEVLDGAVGNVMGLPGSPRPPRRLFAAERINRYLAKAQECEHLATQLRHPPRVQTASAYRMRASAFDTLMRL
jgi:hypothetical protein